MEEFIKIVEQYVENGQRCMEESAKIDDEKMAGGLFHFWDGFHNCAENILRELKDFRPKSL